MDVVSGCVVGQIESWTFPSDLSGNLSWPFAFQRGE
jgi:hypothetical protein